ncbi:MAG: hypothetical protein RJA70_4852 [Pseudomonadota bacterium]|jgi:16S rRNA (guanine527-N7)-methyltransferase
MTAITTMTSDDFLPRIRRVVDELRPSDFPEPRTPEADCLETLERYLRLITEWNARMDLTAARNPAELVDLFIADAWFLHQALGAETGQALGSCVDVGTGAGAPGLPLKVFTPALPVTLVEPLTKRVAFLRTALGTLQLPGLQVRRARSEELSAGQFEIAISRATLGPEQWLAEGARIATRQVWVLLAKEAPPAREGWLPDLDITYRWPITGAARRAVRYRREE